jgi:hypothetical protein
MILQNWTDALQLSFYSLLFWVVNFLPQLVLAVLIFVIGWFIAVLIGKVIEQAVRAIRVDHALRSAGVEEVVNRAGYKLDSGAFVGGLIKWFLIVVVLWAALTVMGLTQVTAFIQLGLLPLLGRVIVAAFIIVVAAVVAEVAQNVVAGSARAAGVASAGVAGAVARWAIWVFAILAALDHLQIAPGVTQILSTGIVVALALAFGLAFGLGGQEAAARAIERARDHMRRE